MQSQSIINNVSKVFETDATDTVNKWLNDGWILLNTYPKVRDSSGNPNDCRIWYCLGKPDRI